MSNGITFVWTLETVWTVFVLTVLAGYVVVYVASRVAMATVNKWRRFWRRT